MACGEVGSFYGTQAALNAGKTGSICHMGGAGAGSEMAGAGDVWGRGEARRLLQQCGPLLISLS